MENVTVKADMCANLSKRVDTTQMSHEKVNDLIDYCFNVSIVL